MSLFRQHSTLEANQTQISIVQTKEVFGLKRSTAEWPGQLEHDEISRIRFTNKKSEEKCKRAVAVYEGLLADNNPKRVHEFCSILSLPLSFFARLSIWNYVTSGSYEIGRFKATAIEMILYQP